MNCIILLFKVIKNHGVLSLNAAFFIILFQNSLIMKFTIFIASIFLFNSINNIANSQSFKRGYYINANGDTIKGFVTSLSNGPDFSFSFKATEDSNSIVVPFSTCKVFCIENNSFLKWHGKRSMSYIDKLDQSLVNIDSGITATIPLKQIFKGKQTTLYHFEDQTNHFFIAAEDTIIELLIFYTYSKGWDLYRKRPSTPTYDVHAVFRFQLAGLLGDDERKKNWIEATEFDESSLKKLLQKFD